MDAASSIRLVALSAIWGGSFLFMRIAAPVLGPVVLTASRAVCAALFLLAVGLALRKPLDARRYWKHYLVLGVFNSALPFLLFSFSAQTLSTSLMAILNATAPIFGAVIGALWTRRMPSGRTVAGLVLGVAGVGVLVGADTIALQPGAITAIAAALGASLCYGIATHYAKTVAAAEPFANAHGTMWAAVILVVPAIPFAPPIGAPDALVVAAAAALGLLCTGVAYLIYFRLIRDLGATSALTVTFLIPVFGVLWGSLFLAEAVRWNTLAGAGIVVLGTALVTHFNPLALVRQGGSA